MKLIDFDGLFDEKLAQFMEENKDKYTERQWEDIIPKLYKKFGDTYISKIKCTPKEYFAKMSDNELADCLRAHLKEDIPVSEFLCAEIESRNEVETLLPLLFDEDLRAVSYAVNMLTDDNRAFDAYFRILEENGADEEIRSDITDILRLHADELKERVIANFEKGVAKESMIEILSRAKARDERVYQILLNAFLSNANTQIYAGYLASYGDERALPYLLEKIQDQTIGFVEFQELKYAIEALGGEYDEPRDFSADKDYIAVEADTLSRSKAKDEPYRS